MALPRLKILLWVSFGEIIINFPLKQSNILYLFNNDFWEMEVGILGSEAGVLGRGLIIFKSLAPISYSKIQIWQNLNLTKLLGTSLFCIGWWR